MVACQWFVRAVSGFKGLVPPFLRKLRDVLQQRVIRFLLDQSRKEPEKYARFFEDYGLFMREGIVTTSEQDVKVTGRGAWPFNAVIMMALIRLPSRRSRSHYSAMVTTPDPVCCMFCELWGYIFCVSVVILKGCVSLPTPSLVPSLSLSLGLALTLRLSVSVSLSLRYYSVICLTG